MQYKIDDAGGYQDIDKFRPPGQPKGRIDSDSQGSGFLRPFLIMDSRFNEKFIFSRRNVPESDTVVSVR